MSFDSSAVRDLLAPVRDPARVAAVRDTGLLDAPRSIGLDRLARLSQRTLDVPVVLITLVDAERDYIVGGAGLQDGQADLYVIRNGPTFSQYAVATQQTFTVSDVATHPTFSSYPQAITPCIAACANAPLISTQGYVLGNLCAIEHEPRIWSDDDIDALNTIADAISTELELRIAQRSAEQSAYQALHDPLTGLANRTLFLDRVEHAIARADRGEHVAVLFVDLDDFKLVNDRLGHAQGDALLAAVADRLRLATRTSDTVARLGGDEFAVLLEAMSTEYDANAAAARVTSSLQSPVRIGSQDVTVSASIGVAYTRGAERVDELLQNADLAMYRAKRAGKGTTAVFEPSMQAAMRDRLQLSDDVRRAIDGNQLHLLYQPIVDISGTTLRGIEALARWQHPTRGAVSPTSFIPIAEESTAILSIGRWTLKESCAQLHKWDAEWRNRPLDMAAQRRYGSPSVHINVAGRHLYDPSLLRDVEDALSSTGVSPERVVIEVSETAIMQRMDQALTAFRALKAMGVRLAIDDFGTGALSLKYLQQFPVDILKVDRRFVAELGTEGGSSRLARGVVALGDALGLQMIAEGVESPVQRRELRMLGCNAAQGYLFSPALQPSQLITWASAQNARHLPPAVVRASQLGAHHL